MSAGSFAGIGVVNSVFDQTCYIAGDTVFDAGFRVCLIIEQEDDLEKSKRREKKSKSHLRSGLY
jgi:hypothetical protein